MTVDEFREQAGTIPCLYDNCKSLLLNMRKKNQHIELFCSSCGRHQSFLGQSTQPQKRPRLQNGTLDEVWAESGGTCAHCGLHEAILEVLGLYRTVQHVPPFAVNGHEGYLIPLCNWCQAHSAIEMKRLTALVERLAKKFDVRG